MAQIFAHREDQSLRRRLGEVEDAQFAEGVAAAHIPSPSKRISNEIKKELLRETKAPFDISNLQYHENPISNNYGSILLFNEMVKGLKNTLIYSELTEKVPNIIMDTVGSWLTCSTVFYLVFLELRKFFDKKITLQRLIKNTSDIFLASLSSYFAGNMALFFVGPYFGIIAAPIIGTLAAIFVTSLVDKFSQKKLGIPKEEMIENAYAYLRVDPTDCNSIVNDAFRHKCLRNHPDHGGNQSDFDRTREMMRIVKISRREY